MSFGGLQMPVLHMTLAHCTSCVSPSVLVSASFMVGGLLKDHRSTYPLFSLVSSRRVGE